MLVLCAICNELLGSSVEIFITSCGHVFHYKCLSQWLPRSPTCPECRRRTTPSTIQKIYFNICANRSLLEEPAVLQEQLSDAKLRITDLEKSLEYSNDTLKSSEKKVLKLEKKLTKTSAAFDKMKYQYNYFKDQMKELSELREQIQKMQEKVQSLEKVDLLLKSTCKEVDAMLSNNTSVADLASFVSTLKSKLTSSEEKQNNLKLGYQKLQLEVIKYKTQCIRFKEKLEMHREKSNLLERIAELESIVELNKSTPPKTKVLNNSNKSPDSPYLQVQSSSYGMMPLRTLSNNIPLEAKRKLATDNNQYSIFKKSRLNKCQTMASLYSQNLNKKWKEF
ncbi:E3 ubiquitin-protein ligase TRAIP-like isoform X2 [Ctenocephalides felis]|uniref:E3 ubiquitin-protein ligase TRAIP-like isoform X2 n=1 Tax=Ctenocephalides felis TaxID=7515 RepID=UPI000E6E48A2|nr:E3 ubiquitin-protein ligase TRAIP-like isoform X2 [Ctenocephalides felis]